MSYGKPWQGRPAGRPVWNTMTELYAILDKYRSWREQGADDQQMTHLIRLHYPQPADRYGNR